MLLLKSELKANKWIIIVSLFIFFLPLSFIPGFGDNRKNIELLKYFIVVFNFGIFLYMSITYLNVKYGKFKKVLMSLPTNKAEFIRSSLIYIILTYFISMLFTIIVTYIFRLLFPELHFDFMFSGGYYTISMIIFVLLTYLLVAFQFGWRSFSLLILSPMPFSYLSIYRYIFKLFKLDNMRFIGLPDKRFSKDNILLIIGYVLSIFIMFLVLRFIMTKAGYKFSTKKAFINSLKVSLSITLIVVIITLMHLFCKHITFYYLSVIAGDMSYNWNYLIVFSLIFMTCIGLLFWVQNVFKFKNNLILGIFVLVGNFTIFTTLFFIHICHPAIINITFITIHFYLLYRFMLKIEPLSRLQR